MENALRACCKGIKIGKILILGQGTDGRQVCGCQYIVFSYSSKLRICFGGLFNQVYLLNK